MEIIFKALNTSSQFFMGLCLSFMALQIVIVFFVLYRNATDCNRTNCILCMATFMTTGIAGIIYTLHILGEHIALLSAMPENGWQYEGFVIMFDMMIATVAIPVIKAVTKALIRGARCFSFDRNLLVAGHNAGYDLAKTISEAICRVKSNFGEWKEDEELC